MFYFLVVVAVFSHAILSAVESLELDRVSSVRNVRPVLPRRIYRSATLDELSVRDARYLMEDHPFATIIDLRNADEQIKKNTTLSEGAALYYEWLRDPNNSEGKTELIHLPILRDVDAFWDITIASMPLQKRIQATAQTVFEAGALDRAAARYLESEGLFGMYRSLLQSGRLEFLQGLELCLESTEQPILIHCQKGKDRTGLLSMLVQHCLGASVTEIVEAYSLSESLLGEGQEIKAGNSNNAFIDWNLFRGSPAQAMEDTVSWINAKYGSIDDYLDEIGFVDYKRSRFRQKYT